ncbi:MAG: zinc-ribbon domain-containing protein [Treponematales bacterium]
MEKFIGIAVIGIVVIAGVEWSIGKAIGKNLSHGAGMILGVIGVLFGFTCVAGIACIIYSQKNRGGATIGVNLHPSPYPDDVFNAKNQIPVYAVKQWPEPEPALPEPKPMLIAERTDTAEWRCEVCGTPLKDGMIFCGGCGAKVEAPPPAATPAPVPAAATAVSDETCAACGKPVEAEWKVCPFCKAALVRERRCGNCGRKLEPEWNACPFCGTEAAGNSGGAALSGDVSEKAEIDWDKIPKEVLEKAWVVMDLGYGRSSAIAQLIKIGLSEQQAETFYEKERPLE